VRTPGRRPVDLELRSELVPSRLLVNEGRLFSRQRHDEVHLPDGTVLPVRQDVYRDGTALPFQRPLVVLIGPGSISRAESFAGPCKPTVAPPW
jgi:hypothetical protein